MNVHANVMTAHFFKWGISINTDSCFKKFFNQKEQLYNAKADKLKLFK